MGVSKLCFRKKEVCLSQSLISRVKYYSSQFSTTVDSRSHVFFPSHKSSSGWHRKRTHHQGSHVPAKCSQHFADGDRTTLGTQDCDLPLPVRLSSCRDDECCDSRDIGVACTSTCITHPMLQDVHQRHHTRCHNSIILRSGSLAMQCRTEFRLSPTHSGPYHEELLHTSRGMRKLGTLRGV